MRAAAAATGAAPAPLQPLPHQLQAPYDAHCLEIIKKVTAIFSEPPPGGINVVGFVDDLADAFNKQEFQIQNLIDLTKCIEGFQALSSADQLVLFKATFPEILFLRSAYFFNFEKNAFLMRIVSSSSGDFEKTESLSKRSFLVFVLESQSGERRLREAGNAVRPVDGAAPHSPEAGLYGPR